jgi:hypothetical protein
MWLLYEMAELRNVFGVTSETLTAIGSSLEPASRFFYYPQNSRADKLNRDDVILEKEKKASIIDDVIGFFNAESRYSEFGVPWKRGVIFYGPPGVKTLFLLQCAR